MTHTLNARGWHSTGVCATFGAAAAAGHVLGLDAPRLASALGLAGPFTGGLWAFVDDGSMSKRWHAGRAAEGGLTAALMAAGGFTGPRSIFEAGWGGHLTTYAGPDADPVELTRDLRETWRIELCSIKPHASCRGTHAAVDAMLGLARDQALRASQISSVQVRLSPFLNSMCGRTTRPASLVDAQLSLPFTLAAAAVRGRVGVEEVSGAALADREILALMERVTLVVDPARQGSDSPWIVVHTTDGITHTLRVDDPLGSPTNPLSPAAVAGKFQALAQHSLSAPHAERLRDTVLTLDTAKDTTALVTGLRGEALAPPLTCTTGEQ